MDKRPIENVALSFILHGGQFMEIKYRKTNVLYLNLLLTFQTIHGGQDIWHEYYIAMDDDNMMLQTLK